jgi:hypothetical protein
VSKSVNNQENTLSLAVEKSIFPRTSVKTAAATLVDRCHVLLDLDHAGCVTVTLRPLSTKEAPDLEALAGGLGNLLLAELVRRNLDQDMRTAQQLTLARALDGALPGGPTTATFGPQTPKENGREDHHGR